MGRWLPLRRKPSRILEARRAEFRRRRDFLAPALSALGFRITAQPQGAFYLYCDCSALSDDSFQLARDLLETVGVAATPGLDFGSNAPERHIRFAYTTGIERLAEAVERLAALFRAAELAPDSAARDVAQSKQGPGSVLRPGATWQWPAIAVIG